jgi:hypothetical protein
MLEEIRRLLRKIPFAAFRLHLTDGRKLDVPHPDFVWLPKPGIFFYYHADKEASDRIERINPLLIISVESPNGAEPH